MTDYLFEEILNKQANLTRPQVAVDTQHLPREPQYYLLQAALAVRLRPVRAGLDDSLLGRFPQATAVGYALPGDLRSHDQLGVVLASTVLSEAASAEAQTLSLESATAVEAGSRLHLRDEEAFAEVVVESVQGDTVTLREILPTEFPAEATVEVVESYQVLAAEDGGGAGHHLRLALRQRQV